MNAALKRAQEFKAVVRTKEEMNPGLKFKQVVQKHLKKHNLPLQDLPETAPPQTLILLSLKLLGKCHYFLSSFYILLFRLSSCTSICSFRSCPRSYCSSTRWRRRGPSSRQRGTQSPSRRRGFWKTEEADIGLKKLYMHADHRWKFGPVNPSLFSIYPEF